MSSHAILALIGVLFLAVVHVAAGALRRGATARSRWLSAASGLSVAYVFVHLLPELGEMQALWLEERPIRRLMWFESHVYVMALIGVLIALRLDRMKTRRASHERFWVQIVALGTYNLIVGMFSVRLAGVLPLILAALAFGAHFLVNDRELLEREPRRFRSYGRWILAGAVVLGWATAVTWEPPKILLAALLGLLAGGIILDVLRKELSEDRLGHFRAFAAGAVGFTALLIALSYAQYAAGGEAAREEPDAVTTIDRRR